MVAKQRKPCWTSYFCVTRSTVSIFVHRSVFANNAGMLGEIAAYRRNTSCELRWTRIWDRHAVDTSVIFSHPCNLLGLNISRDLRKKCRQIPTFYPGYISFQGVFLPLLLSSSSISPFSEIILWEYSRIAIVLSGHGCRAQLTKRYLSCFDLPNSSCFLHESLSPPTSSFIGFVWLNQCRFCRLWCLLCFAASDFHVGAWKGRGLPEQSHTAKYNFMQMTVSLTTGVVTEVHLYEVFKAAPLYF